MEMAGISGRKAAYLYVAMPFWYPVIEITYSFSKKTENQSSNAWYFRLGKKVTKCGFSAAFSVER